MTNATYRALAKQHTSIQRRISVMVDKKKIEREKLRERHAHAEQVAMKQWDKHVAKLEKQLISVENRIDYYEQHG